ncbi:MAG: hypothetical protein KAT26_12945, partial [Marinosulfonomonas sp.]|nr:hypothetical protein [Marinosulfonomonas sp.]
DRVTETNSHPAASKYFVSASTVQDEPINPRPEFRTSIRGESWPSFLVRTSTNGGAFKTSMQVS